MYAMLSIFVTSYNIALSILNNGLTCSIPLNAKQYVCEARMIE